MSRKSKLQVAPEGMTIEQEEAPKPIQIKAASLRGLFCHYSYDETVGPNTVNGVNIKSAVPVHKDLTAAFEALNPHLAVICEEVDPTLIRDITKIEKFDVKVHAHETIQYKISTFTVGAFRLTGEGDSKAVTLVGSKRLSTGDTVHLTTPPVKYDSNYDFLHDLIMAVDDLVDEVEQYMKGKQAPVYVQTEMGFEGDEEKYSEEGI